MHGNNRLFVISSLMLSSMVSHGFTPSDMNISTLVPIPKNTRKSLNDSDNYVLLVSCWTRSYSTNVIMLS